MKKPNNAMLIFGFIFLVIFSTFFSQNKFKSKNDAMDNTTSYDVQAFDLSNYQRQIEIYSYPKNVGQIETVEKAVSTAEQLWLEKYSTVNGKPYNPINEEPIIVSYDKMSNCWLIHGTVPSNTLGAAPHALIQRDGTVLAIWMG